jgi:predicted PurR-regulated permease PerM
MYTGLQLIGFAGLIIGPITYLLIRNILFTIYKNWTIKDIIGFEPEKAANK